ncbi:hypothetical protein B0H15DRAFT_944731 [Mycena belliarum]|uniref:Ribonuclease H1 N-terminal domain-containing protein n=1 Tax=Mycena belliarum TaxID=1033014 RepID=A0AAD6UCQ4_9AGAR|nr:hypothetical protein B0H15DRAFT_807182 [Mycena belliae]KAJ7099319.1 hypothetical protein B0H15DRAFT_944731 [Mycena belliae]
MVDTSQTHPDIAALVFQVALLSQSALALAQRSVEIHTQLPLAFQAAVAEAVAAALPTPNVWTSGTPRTPDEVEAAHPPGSGDDVAYHVVYAGREPGIYSSVPQSDAQVHGVPAAKRSRKGSRREALAFYRLMYESQQVEKWVESLPDA